MQQSKFENFKNNVKSDFFEINEYFDGNKKSYERELKRGINRKELIKTVRQIAIGFDNVDLRKPISDYQYKKARKILGEFIAGTEARYIPIRPSAKHRKKYAQLSDMPDYFKIYPVPVSGDITRFDFENGKIIERGPNIDYSTYFFENQSAFAANQKREIRRLIREIEKKENYDFSKRGKKQLRIKVGKYHTFASYDKESVIDEILDWNEAYGIERVNAFVRGFAVAEFHDQKRKPKKSVKKKRFKKKK